MAASGQLALLVTSRDEPGVLYRISEVIYRHGANITYIATSAVAETQIEMEGVRDDAGLIADLERLEVVHAVRRVPSFQEVFGKRVIVMGGGALVGGEITDAVREIQAAGIIVVSTSMAGSVVDAVDLVVSDPLEAGVMSVMLIADTARFSIERVRGRRF